VPVDRLRLLESGIRTYFRFCPLCLAEGSIESQIHPTRGPMDYITCTHCLAKWHVWIGKAAWDLGRFSWAELITDGVDGKGAMLLGEREKPEFWQQMALKARREMPQVDGKHPSVVIKEKEVIKEIVKVRCRHCGCLCLETLDKCPNCGASL